MWKSILAVVLGLTLVASTGLSQGMRATPEQRTQRLKDTLALNEEQASRVLKIYQEMDQQRSELFSASGGDRQAMMESMRSLNEKTDGKIEFLLTAAQKVKYAALKKQREEMRRNRGN